MILGVDMPLFVARATHVVLILCLLMAARDMQGARDPQVRLLRTGIVLESMTWPAGWLLPRFSMNNHWISHWAAPPVYLCLVSVLAMWLPRPGRRLALIGSALVLVVWLTAEVTIENAETFPLAGAPLVQLWAVGVTAGVVISRMHPHLDVYRDGVATLA